MRRGAHLPGVVGQRRHAADRASADGPRRVGHVALERLRAPPDHVLVELDRAVHVARLQLVPDEVALCVAHRLSPSRCRLPKAYYPPVGVLGSIPCVTDAIHEPCAPGVRCGRPGAGMHPPRSLAGVVRRTVLATLLGTPTIATALGPAIAPAIAFATESAGAAKGPIPPANAGTRCPPRTAATCSTGSCRSPAIASPSWDTGSSTAATLTTRRRSIRSPSSPSPAPRAKRRWRASSSTPTTRHRSTLPIP